MDPFTNNNQTVPNKNLLRTPEANRPDQPEEKGTLEQLGGIGCTLCDGTFEHRKQFDEHFATQHKDASLEYKCILCNKTFEKYKPFHDHCYRHVSGKRFRCEKCLKQFSQQTYELHMQMFHAEVQREAGQRYSCALCSRDFNTFKHLAQHMRVCTRAQPYTCTVCNKSFSEKSFLLRHIPFHSEIRNFKCNFCERSFKTKRCLSRHSTLHGGKRKLNYDCKQCQKKFLTSTKLAFHMNTHSNDRPYRCDHCDMTFTNNPNRIKHLRHHIRRKQDLCGHRNWVLLGKYIRSDPSEEQTNFDNAIADNDLKAKQSDHIEVHGTLHTGDGLEQFCCAYCGERFPYRRSWLRHMNRRHIQYKYYCDTCNEIIVCANPISFLCDYCGKGFTDKSSLIRHILHMHMQCKYNCNICNRDFLLHSDLESHLRKHNVPTKTEQVVRIASMVPVTAPKKNNVVKEFTCQYCQKDFTYLRSCMRHMKREHNHKIEKKRKVSQNEGDSSAVSVEIKTKKKPKVTRIAVEINLKNEIERKPKASQSSVVIETKNKFETKPKVSQSKGEGDSWAVSVEIDMKNLDRNEENAQDAGPKFTEVKSQNTMLYLPYILPVPVSQQYYFVVNDEMASKGEQMLEMPRDPTKVNITNISSVIRTKTPEEQLNNSEKLDEDLLRFLGTIMDGNSTSNSSRIDELNCSEFTSFREEGRKEKYNLFPRVQLESADTTESIHQTVVYTQRDSHQYTPDLDISNEEYSKIWNKGPQEDISDIFGLNDDIILPHIDPLLTIKKANYDEQINENVFPDLIGNGNSLETKDVDELISVEKLHCLFNDVPEELSNVSQPSAFISENSNATEGYDEYINNILPTLCADPIKSVNAKIYDSETKIKSEYYSSINNIAENNYSNNILTLYDQDERPNRCEVKAAVIADIKSYNFLIDGCQSYKPQSTMRINAIAR